MDMQVIKFEYKCADYDLWKQIMIYGNLCRLNFCSIFIPLC